jgi:hypothetical protein
LPVNQRLKDRLPRITQLSSWPFIGTPSFGETKNVPTASIVVRDGGAVGYRHLSFSQLASSLITVDG